MCKEILSTLFLHELLQNFVITSNILIIFHIKYRKKHLEALMSGKTKIIVLRTKEIIYTVLFAVIGIVLVSLFIFGFTKKSGEKENKN